MKKIVALAMVFLLALSYTACGTTADSQVDSTEKITQSVTEASAEMPVEVPTKVPTEEPTETPTEAPTTELEPAPVDASPFTEGSIAYYKYAWGTSFEEVKSNEIAPWMIEGVHYGYYDSGLSVFAKELVVDDEIKGAYFVTRLDFDWNDQLVSVMPVLEESLSDRDRAELYLELVAQCKELYGEPEKVVGPTIEEDTDIDQFTQIVTGGLASNYIWLDANQNQVVLNCHMGQTRLEVVVIFNTKDYRM